MAQRKDNFTVQKKSNMRQNPDMGIAAAIERLTGTRINFDNEEIKGRNIWGRVSFNRSGMLHIEIMPKDKLVNDAAMPLVSKDVMQLGRESRRELYQKSCREIAESMNSQAIEENDLILFISSNGHLTKKAKALIETLL